MKCGRSSKVEFRRNPPAWGFESFRPRHRRLCFPAGFSPFFLSSTARGRWREGLCVGWGARRGPASKKRKESRWRHRRRAEVVAQASLSCPCGAIHLLAPYRAGNSPSPVSTCALCQPMAEGRTLSCLPWPSASLTALDLHSQYYSYVTKP